MQGAYSPPDAKYVAKIGLRVRDLRVKYGILDRAPRHIMEGPLSTNKRIAEALFSRCHEMELESAPTYKIWAYRRAGWTVDELETDILALYSRGMKSLQALPHIGPSIAAFIAERLETT